MKPVKLNHRFCASGVQVQTTRHFFFIKPNVHLKQTKVGLKTQSGYGNYKFHVKLSQMFQSRCYLTVVDDIACKFRDEMKELCTNGQYLKAYNSYKAMKQHTTLDISVLEHLIDGFATKEQHPDKMLEIFDEYVKLKRVEPANLLRIWNSVLHSLRNQQNPLVFKYFTLFTQDSRVKPNEYTYTTMIYAYYHWQDSLALFRSMPVQYRDRGAFVAILNKLANAKQVDTIFDVYKMYKQEVGIPDIVVYGILLKAARNAKTAERLESVLAEMKANRMRHNQVTYGIIIDTYSRFNNFEKMTYWFEKMAAAGIYTNAFHFNSILASFNSSSQITRLLEWYDSMKLLGVKPTQKTYKVVLTQLSRYGTTNHMVSFFKQIEKTDLDADHYSAMIQGFIRAEDVASADEYFQEMIKKGIKPNGQLMSLMRKTLPEKYCDWSVPQDAYLQTIAAVE